MSFCFPLQDRMFIKTSIRINLLWYVRLYLLFWWVICITFNYILLQYIINGTPLASFFFSRYKKEWTEMKRELGIISFELMTFTTSRWHSTTELYPYFHLKGGTFSILLISENLAIDRGVSSYIYNKNGFILYLVEVLMNKKMGLPVIL